MILHEWMLSSNDDQRCVSHEHFEPPAYHEPNIRRMKHHPILSIARTNMDPWQSLRTILWKEKKKEAFAGGEAEVWSRNIRWSRDFG